MVKAPVASLAVPDFSQLKDDIATTLHLRHFFHSQACPHDVRAERSPAAAPELPLPYAGDVHHPILPTNIEPRPWHDQPAVPLPVGVEILQNFSPRRA